jgi:hypothetical protein
MGLTLTRVKDAESVHGNRRAVAWDVTFDSSYLAGGEPLTARQLGLRTVLDVTVMPPALGGLSFAYDIANAKLMAKRQSGPPLITEATGTFTAGVAYTLKQKPGYILAVRGTAGSTGAKTIIPVGETPGAGQCAINFSTGVVTWGDAAITAATFVYVPLGVPGFTPDLLVVDEASPIASNSITLVNQAMCIQYVWNDEDNEILVPVTDNVALTGAQCHPDIDNGSGATVIGVTTGRIADGSTGKTKVTYLKRANNPLVFVDQADLTVTSNVAGPGSQAAVFAIPSLILPGYGQALAVSDNTGPAQRPALMVDSGGTAAAGVAVWNPAQNTFTFASADSDDILEMPLVLMGPFAGESAQEVINAADLSWVTGVRLVASGY